MIKPPIIGYDHCTPISLLAVQFIAKLKLLRHEKLRFEIEEAQQVLAAMVLESDDRCGPKKPGDPQPNGLPEPSSLFGESIHEFQQDDTRRSIFANPEENIIANLIDLYTGRLQVLEIRDPNSQYDLDRLKQEAIEQMKATVPFITVNSILADKEEIVETLRNLADMYENGHFDDGGRDEPVQNWNGFLFVQAQNCRRVGTQTQRRFIENGRKLVLETWENWECGNRDSKCCNTALRREKRNFTRKVVWEDGDRSKPPPVMSPPFENRPWDHRCPILPPGTRGTVTSDHGWRENPYGGSEPNWHAGIDIQPHTTQDPNGVGTEVWAGVTGQVVKVVRGNSINTGVYVKVGNRVHRYWHIAPRANLPTQVTPTTVLGTIKAWPGRVARTHVHYGVYEPPNGDYTQISEHNSVDPCP